ncbi:NACHT domain-containing protein [Nocardia sp. NPDC005825]|uniref:NACHT domain-containing protein n=1 Tax=unclassified Nocardia TaxID=2637762 RepID=UPI0033DFE40B
MHRGSERDGVFITDDAIHAYEFTISKKKEKAKGDAEKIAQLLTDLGKIPENKFKARTGWFVTREEPTADQRGAVQDVSRKFGGTIHAVSISVLQSRLCNSEDYLRCRSNAPFGSISSYRTDSGSPEINVKVCYFDAANNRMETPELATKLIDGFRSVVVGDFGVGKSHALRELYMDLRDKHIRSKRATPFPVHINLRDCAGLKTPAEILRRHSEEVGFGSERNLISAWRAGSCILLLDGFDEVVPSRWLGGASDLKDVRRKALFPIRRLVEETPAGTGVVVCGRPQYFSSYVEMPDALGFHPDTGILKIDNFTDEQLSEYLSAAKVEDWAVPEWIPTRPLLIGYLVRRRDFADFDSSEQLSAAVAWRGFFDAICQREAGGLTAVRPAVIKSIISRVATLAKSQGDETTPMGMDVMRKAFIEIYNRQPDEEGNLLLMRLPGLAIAGENDSDTRVFVDRDLADTAYGEDLAAHLINPFAEHPLSMAASWVTSASDLSIEVAASAIESREKTTEGNNKTSARSVLASAKRRQDQGNFDAVLADTLRVVSTLGSNDIPEKSLDSFIIEGVWFHDLQMTSDKLSKRLSYQDCVIQVLDISTTEEGADVPHFSKCIIGFLDGASSLPEWLESYFSKCSIEQFSQQSSTTAGILQLSIDPTDRVALTILKKIYNQRGSGRRESALTRGLDQASRNLVPHALSKLISEGWIHKTTSGGNTLYLPVKGRRASARRALEKPNEFELSPH